MNTRDYQRGWDDARSGKYEFCPGNATPEYQEGFRAGVIAREQAANYDWSDYYVDC